MLSIQTPLREALCLICLSQLQAIRQHQIGAKSGSDPEELHDLRVAVRRTRSVLGEFRSFFPEQQIAYFRAEFRWMGEITGPVRDLDVYLHKLPGYRRLLELEEAEALEPFRSFLLKHRRSERRRLVRRLNSVRIRRLLGEWHAFLESYNDGSWPEAANLPVGETARCHIWKLYRRFLSQGSKVAAKSADVDLHRLRITGKKLRYLVEFFQGLYPAEEIAQLIKAMKGIQDFLGDFQDLTVQQAQLTELSFQMQAEGEVPVETIQALAMLVKILRDRQQRTRKDFPAYFRVFSHGRARRGFMRLYAAPENET